MALTKVKNKVLNQSVDTINDLPETGYDGQTIEVLGYTAAGDGGGGLFRYSTSSATNNGGTIILPSLTMPDYTGTAGSCWHRQYSGAVNVKWFGAYSDGTNTTTTTSAIQSAIGTTNNIFFPKGTYHSNAITVSNNTKIVGENKKETTIVPQAANFILIPDGGSVVYNVEISDLTFDMTTVSSSCIDVASVQHWQFNNIKFTNGTQAAIKIYKAYFNTFNDIHCENTAYGLYLYGTSFDNGPNFNYFNRITFNNTVNWSIRGDFARGNIFRDIDAEYSNTTVSSAIYLYNCSYNTIESFWYEAAFSTAEATNFEGAIRIDGSVVSNNKGNIVRHVPQILGNSGSIHNNGIYVKNSDGTVLENVRLNACAVGIYETGNSNLMIKDPQYDTCTADESLNSNDTSVMAYGNAGLEIKGRINSQLLLDSAANGFNAFRMRNTGTDTFVINIKSTGNEVDFSSSHGRAMSFIDNVAANKSMLRLDHSLNFFAAIAASDCPNNTLFRSSADGKLHYKDSSGVDNALY